MSGMVETNPASLLHAACEVLNTSDPDEKAQLTKRIQQWWERSSAEAVSTPSSAPVPPETPARDGKVSAGLGWAWLASCVLYECTASRWAGLLRALCNAPPRAMAE